MKKLEMLVLNQLAKKELSQRQQTMIKGGRSCTCGCCYASSGGSDTTDNGYANCISGLNTKCSDLSNGTNMIC